MKLLKKLYTINSHSACEQRLSKAIQKYLKKNNIKFKTLDNQIYNIIKDTPILVAHLDQIGEKQVTKITIDGDIVTGDFNIGADDKNGVWIILKLLKDKTLKDKFSFLFTTEEECLSIGAKKLVTVYPNFFDKNKYALILDRRGKGDIIGYDNYYCSEKFEDDVASIGKQFGYEPTPGAVSDCDVFNEYINCVNLSVGYYLSHTDKEFTRFSELKNALNFTKAIINNLTDYYKVEEYHNYHYYDNVRDIYPVSYGYTPVDKTNYTLIDVWCPSCREDNPENITSEYFEDGGDVLLCASCGCIFDKWTGDVLTYCEYLREVAANQIWADTYNTI